MNDINSEWIETIYTTLKEIEICDWDGNNIETLILKLIDDNKDNIINFQFDDDFHDPLFQKATFLHLAVSKKSVKIVRKLIDLGARADIENIAGITAIELAQNFLDTYRSRSPDRHELYREILGILVSTLE